MNNTKQKSRHFRDRIFALARPKGFEPLFSGIGIRCVIQLRHGRLCRTRRARFSVKTIPHNSNVRCCLKYYYTPFAEITQAIFCRSALSSLSLDDDLDLYVEFTCADAGKLLADGAKTSAAVEKQRAVFYVVVAESVFIIDVIVVLEVVKFEF